MKGLNRHVAERCSKNEGNIFRKLINAAPLLAKCSPPPHTRAAKFLYGGAAFINFLFLLILLNPPARFINRQPTYSNQYTVTTMARTQGDPGTRT
jgi:hypothetical protein